MDLAFRIETIKLYSSALSEAASVEQKLVASYQTLLKSTLFGEDQRRRAEKFLSEEKEKLGRLPLVWADKKRPPMGMAAFDLDAWWGALSIRFQRGWNNAGQDFDRR